MGAVFFWAYGNQKETKLILGSAESDFEANTPAANPETVGMDNPQNILGQTTYQLEPSEFGHPQGGCLILDGTICFCS